MRVKSLVVIVLLLASIPSLSQRKILIPAGTPEDKALNAITQEADAAKKRQMLDEFVATYASNKAAVAYGNWQISQSLMGSDPAKALEFGDKALAAMPEVVDILQSQTDLAQQTKQYDKVVDYATRAAVVIGNIGKEPKPADLDESNWKINVERDQKEAQPVYDYLAASAYNAIGAEPDLNKRMTEVERFSEAFKGSKLAEQVAVLAVATLTQMDDHAKLVSYGEKAIKADPENLSLLTVLANAFAEEQSGAQLAEADKYARKAIELAKTDKSTPEDTRLLTEGFAHQVLGYTLLRQEKTPAAILELKTASTMLKSDPAKLSIALYRLGFAYAKSNQVANAKATLAQCMEVDGPFKEAAKELLDKVNAAKARRK